MENEIKRAKRRIIIAFSVLIAVLLIIAAAFCVYRYQHTFSQEKWLSNADGRYMIVADMLEKHPEIFDRPTRYPEGRAEFLKQKEPNHG